ncbi:MAG: helix-turn-helix domain-containing protein, partial [Chloroflexota bacterium]|nr:helix-turn-helix domain-containing protein [Chloroflexota bacterium]
MTKTSNSKIGQKYLFSELYYPTPAVIVEKHGQSAAVVWGIIFGLSQIPIKSGGLGYCNASQVTIGKKAGLTRKTTRAKIDLLVKNGWLEDLTPELIKKPHHYVAGDKAIQSFLRGKLPNMGRNYPSQPPEQSEDPSNMGKNYPSTWGKITPDMGKNYPQIDSLKESLKESINKDSSSSSSSGKNKKTLNQVISNKDDED